MIRAVFGILLCFASVNASAGTFKASNMWYIADTNKVWDFAEISGAVADAAEKALRDCRDSGAARCVLMSTRLDSLQDEYISGVGMARVMRHTVVVKSVDELSLKTGAVFTASEAVNSTRELDTLDNLGTKFGALNRALTDCYAEENDYCAINGMEYEKVNVSEYIAGAGMRFVSKARASVVGLQIAR